MEATASCWPQLLSLPALFPPRLLPFRQRLLLPQSFSAMAAALPAPQEPRSEADLHAMSPIELETWLTRRLGFSCKKAFDLFKTESSWTTKVILPILLQPQYLTFVLNDDLKAQHLIDLL